MTCSIHIALHYLNSCGCCWADFRGVCQEMQCDSDGMQIDGGAGLYIGLKQIGSWIGNVRARLQLMAIVCLLVVIQNSKKQASTSWSLSLFLCACVCFCIDLFTVHLSHSEAVGKSGHGLESPSCNSTWTQLQGDLWPQSVAACLISIHLGRNV